MCRSSKKKGEKKMNRITAVLNELKDKNEKALITFITAGDPNIETTEKLVLEMFENGADIVEIGVPFSDPIAEGKTIQAASLRALTSGETNLDNIFEMVKSLRIKTDKPLLLMMYVNTIFKFGTESFFTLCKGCGVDGVIVPDLPYEERDEILPYAKENGVISISMVTPASHGRIKAITADCEGFLYCVSSNGVTGMRSSFTTNFDEFFEEIKANCKIPAMIGFGISSPEQAKAMSKYCSGVIVGSAIVKIVENYGENSVDEVGKFTSELKKAML